MPENRILVDVSRSRRARAFEEEERLWRGDLKRVIDMIGRHADQLQNGDEPERQPTLSIAIFGPAGSGKSSFLMTLVEDAKKQGLIYEPSGSEPVKLEQVTSLDVIQPARFAPDDHMIYAVVAAALESHRKRHDNERIDYEVLSGVLLAYRKLSDDLHAVHQEVSAANLEPLELAAERVQRHTSGLRLRQKMTTFIDELVDDLAGHRKHSVILLPVDDLDLAPKHLSFSLRALQAYLLHPRLVPIFTFTDRLAEEILIGEFEKSFHTRDNGDAKSEAITKTGQLSVSQQLAIQYLTKCFPIRNRVRLGPAAAILQTADAEPETKSGSKDVNAYKAAKEPTLVPLVAASELLFGYPDRSTRHPVYAALRPTTLRRQFQVIDSVRQAGVRELLCKRHVQRAGLRGQLDLPEHPRLITDRGRPWGPALRSGRLGPHERPSRRLTRVQSLSRKPL